MTYHSTAQLENTNRWIADYVTVNREILTTFGISAREIREQYEKAVPPHRQIGWKTLAPLLSNHGLEKYKNKAGIHYTFKP
jgi:hypothetical protein